MRSLIPLMFVAAVVSACATGLAIEQRFLENVDTSGWKSYAWSEALPSGSDTAVRDVNERIRTEIDAKLAALGYTRTTSDSADFLVNHAIYAHWEVVEYTKRDERGVREQGLSHEDRTMAVKPDIDAGAREHGEGKLYVFVSNPAGRGVWQGSVETPLKYRGAGIRKISAAVKELFAEFPARTR